MRFSVVSGAALSLAASTSAFNFSTASDLDGSVWDALNLDARSTFEPVSNRPAKRQSGWSPPSNLATPLREVWDHCKQTYNNGNIFGFKNYGWDQLMATQGTINMCVRWESNTPVTEAQRAQIATAANAQYQKWFKWLYGYDNFPFTSVKVNVVGWAVRDKSLLQGSTSGIDVYTNKDSGGIPECAPACGRFFHQDGNYNSCPGGAARHYDQSLWLTDGMAGGAGGDWGQRIGREYFMGALNSDSIHILLHEMGHTFGLDDFYDWTPTGIKNFIMLAGSASTITDFDGWMLRNWWYELSRNRKWTSGSAPAPASSTSKPPQAATTTRASARPSTTAAPAPAPTGGATAPQYGQCGGNGWTGPTKCASPFTCKPVNEWYSQCV
ncbi:Xyloglucanase [Paramyrothecium foliicola]|nr:Xyloglucanase [Paramyrothecium foliicola]